MKNLFCDILDLSNESDVEQSFARRLVEALGYPDRAIRTKETLERLSVGQTDRRLPQARLRHQGAGAHKVDTGGEAIQLRTC